MNHYRQKSKVLYSSLKSFFGYENMKTKYGLNFIVLTVQFPSQHASYPYILEFHHYWVVATERNRYDRTIVINKKDRKTFFDK